MSWTQATWYVDPVNASGCSSDTNLTCSLSTCGISGDGPCKTFAQMAARWGTYEPQIRQDTTITFLSSHPDNTDPVVLRPYIENGAHFTLQGVLGAAQEVAHGTIASITAKNRSTPQLLQADLGGGTVDGGGLPVDGGQAGIAIGDLLVNTTHSSRAWVYNSVSGTTYTITQPLAPSVPPVVEDPGEPVTPWANSDVWAAYVPVGVYLVDISPTWEDLNMNTGDNVVVVYQITDTYPGVQNGLGFMRIGEDVEFVESNLGLGQVGMTTSALTFQWIFFNDFIVGDMIAAFGIPPNSFGGTTLPLATFYGGAFGGPGGNLEMSGVATNDDIIFGGGGSQGAGITAARLGTTYIDNGTSLVVNGQSSIQDSGVIWGPGTFRLQGASRLSFQGTTAVQALLLTADAGIQINGLTSACAETNALTIGAAPTFCCDIAITPHAIDGPACALYDGGGATAQGFGGTAFIFGGASITSGAP